MQRTTRGQANWHIGKQAHAKSRQGGNGRSPRDVIPSNGVQAKTVGLIIGTGWIRFVFAYTRATGVGQDGRIDLLIRDPAVSSPSQVPSHVSKKLCIRK